MVRLLVGPEDAVVMVFLFTFWCAMAIPGIFAVEFGFRLCRAITKRNIKGAVGAIAALAVLPALSLFPEKPNDRGVTLAFFLVTLIAILLYAGLSRLLMNKAGLIPSRGEFIGKGIVLLVSVMIWLAIANAVRKFAPGREAYDHPFENPWLWVENFGSILIAWTFYKIAMRIIVRDCDGQNDPPDG
jgi:hypothetical protein